MVYLPYQFHYYNYNYRINYLIGQLYHFPLY
nr:MAG TPA: hypothetical protein [Bacteriophage sp.]